MNLKSLAFAAWVMAGATASASDGTLDTSFGNGGQRVLSYQVASNEPDQGLAILHDSLGRRIVIVVRRNPFPLGPERPLELILFRYLADGSVDTDLIWEQLSTCYDPEIPINIVELGLIYRCEVKASEDGGNRVEIDMTLTAPGCGMGPFLVDDVRTKVAQVPNVSDVEVELVFDPPWNQEMMSEAARLETGLY